MNTFQALQKALRVLSPSQLKAVAEASDVPIYTVSKIRSGETANPRVKTVEAIWKGLEQVGPTVPSELQEAQA